MEKWKELNFNLILRTISYRIYQLEKEGLEEEKKELKKEYKKILQLQQLSNKQN